MELLMRVVVPFLFLLEMYRKCAKCISFRRFESGEKFLWVRAGSGAVSGNPAEFLRTHF